MDIQNKRKLIKFVGVFSGIFLGIISTLLVIFGGANLYAGSQNSCFAVDGVSIKMVKSGEDVTINGKQCNCNSNLKLVCVGIPSGIDKENGVVLDPTGGDTGVPLEDSNTGSDGVNKGEGDNNDKSDKDNDNIKPVEQPNQVVDNRISRFSTNLITGLRVPRDSDIDGHLYPKFNEIKYIAELGAPTIQKLTTPNTYYKVTFATYPYFNIFVGQVSGGDIGYQHCGSAFSKVGPFAYSGGFAKIQCKDNGNGTFTIKGMHPAIFKHDGEFIDISTTMEFTNIVAEDKDKAVSLMKLMFSNLDVFSGAMVGIVDNPNPHVSYWTHQSTDWQQGYYGAVFEFAYGKVSEFVYGGDKNSEYLKYNFVVPSLPDPGYSLNILVTCYDRSVIIEPAQETGDPFKVISRYTVGTEGESLHPPQDRGFGLVGIADESDICKGASDPYITIAVEPRRGSGNYPQVVVTDYKGSGVIKVPKSRNADVRVVM